MKKSAVTVLYIYGLLLISYLPFGVTALVEAVIGYTRSVKIAYDYAKTDVLINSLLDPLAVLLANKGDTTSCKEYSEKTMNT